MTLAIPIRAAGHSGEKEINGIRESNCSFLGELRGPVKQRHEEGKHPPSHCGFNRSTQRTHFIVSIWWRQRAALGHPALRGTCTSLCNGISPATDSGLILITSTNKKGHPMGDLLCWWRRRESNPRPQVLRLWLYMLIRSIDLVDGYPTGRENQQRAWISFNESTPGVLHRDPI